ncbi:MAG: DUF459 domain-containing protein, partial [Alphaproteobacteria bacterium]|nr:DUF459 domain-containing protein [Alphaproteobacteria bacterium]
PAGAEEAKPPPPKPFTLVVIGDSLADGLWGGLFRVLQRDTTLIVLRRARNGTGLSRPDRFDWFKALDRILEEDTPDGVLIAFGLNDRQDMLDEPRRRILLRSEEWTRVYSGRVAALIRHLTGKGIAVYWAGLPVMRDEAVSDDMRHLNEIYRKTAEENGARFFPLWDVSANAEGRFESYFKDDEGMTHRYRADDGIHFTSVGYDRLIKTLLPWLRSDIGNAAKRQTHG